MHFFFVPRMHTHIANVNANCITLAVAYREHEQPVIMITNANMWKVTRPIIQVPGPLLPPQNEMDGSRDLLTSII